MRKKWRIWPQRDKGLERKQNARPKNLCSIRLPRPHFRLFPAHPINLFLDDLGYGLKQLGLGQELCRRVGFCRWRGGDGGGGGEGGGGALAALVLSPLLQLLAPPHAPPPVLSSLGLCVHLGKPHRSRACCFQRPGFESVEPPSLSSAMARRGCFQAPIRGSLYKRCLKAPSSDLYRNVRKRPVQR